MSMSLDVHTAVLNDGASGVIDWYFSSGAEEIQLARGPC